MASTAEKLDPELWEQAKADARDAFGGHSARAMQLAVKLYKQRGGRYRGPKKKDNRLTQWSRQDWKTKSGRPSRETGERYLPAAAIESLTPAEYGATTRAKRRGGGVGSVVAQPQSIREKTRKFRKVNPDMATAKQIAARKKFAERARSGELAKMRKKNPVKKPTRAASRKANPITETLIYGLPRGEDRDYMEELLYGGGLKLNNQQVNQVLKAASDAGYHSFRITGFDPTVMPDFGVNVLNVPKRRRNPTATRSPERKRTKLIQNGERKKNPMAPAVKVSSDSMFKYAVEAKRMLGSAGSVFETIAAFQTKAQAQDYAKAILASNPKVTLRVKTYGGRSK